MKRLFVAISCLVMSALAYCQTQSYVIYEPQRYMIVNEEIHPYNILHLDTSCGTLYSINYNNDAKKTKVTKFEGVPEIPESEGYPGRFSLLFDRGSARSTFMLIDHKTGDVWQNWQKEKNFLLIKIFDKQTGAINAE